MSDVNYKMTTLRAIDLVEGVEAADNEDVLREAWQFLIDEGTVWSLQGSYGRGAMQMIRNGAVVPPKELAHLSPRPIEDDGSNMMA